MDIKVTAKKLSSLLSLITIFLTLNINANAADTCQVTPSGQTLIGGNSFLKLGNTPEYRLVFNNTVFNYPSVNIFNLFSMYINGMPCDGKKYLNAASAAGFKSARFFAAGSYNESKKQSDSLVLWKQDPTAYFNLVDQMINDAKEAGIYLIPSLTTGIFDANEPHPINSDGCQSALPLIPGTNNRANTEKFIADWSNRYSFNSTILFWDLGNELNLLATYRDPNKLCIDEVDIKKFIEATSFLIKSYDKNHLVTSGTMQENDGNDQNNNFTDISKIDRYIDTYTNLPNVDFVSLHLYDGMKFKDSLNNQLPIADVLSHISNIAHTNKKALQIDELGVNGDHSSWQAEPFSDLVQSILLAKNALGIDSVSAWNWDNGKFASPEHLEQTRYSIDPSNSDAISALTQTSSHLGLPSTLNWQFVTGDFNGDKKTDIAAYSDRGLFQVALTGVSEAQIASQWLSGYGDKNTDTGFTNAKIIAGDWNGDGKTDLLIKTKDGRWYVALSNGTNFLKSGLWLSNFANENGTDIALNAGIQIISGDWNGDKKTDIGFKTRDGRWYVAFSDGTKFTNTALWLNGYGNEGGQDIAMNAGTTAIVGDWNGDNKTDIGFKTRDGRWYVAFSDGTKFTNTALWLSGYGNEGGQDIAMNAGTTAIVGDWNGDNKTDIGFKTKDGRWYVAFNTANQFTNNWLWHSRFGNEFSTTDPGQQGGIPLLGNWTGVGKTSFGYRTSDGRIYINFTNFPNINAVEWLVK